MNIAAYIRINAAVFWLLPLAAAAAALPLDEALWVEVNPLGGVFTNGTYECRGKNVQVFARAAEAPNRYWHVALVESPPHARRNGRYDVEDSGHRA